MIKNLYQIIIEELKDYKKNKNNVNLKYINYLIKYYFYEKGNFDNIKLNWEKSNKFKLIFEIEFFKDIEIMIIPLETDFIVNIKENFTDEISSLSSNISWKFYKILTTEIKLKEVDYEFFSSII